MQIITLFVQELWNECPDFILFHEISTVEKRHVEKMWFVDGGRKIQDLNLFTLVIDLQSVNFLNLPEYIYIKERGRELNSIL